MYIKYTYVLIGFIMIIIYDKKYINIKQILIWDNLKIYIN